MAFSTSSNTPTVSVEYFPPKGLSAERALMTGAHALRRFKPAYQTVTFGAGGTATDGCFEWCTQLQELNEVPTASHIALCHFKEPAELFAFTEQLWEAGIKRIVLLRGDVQPGMGDGLGGFASVADATRQLKKQHKFDISVSAYPEIHPMAHSLNADLDVLMEKQDAGADRAITQYFFNNEDFYRFRDLATKRGFRRDLVPGVIPITNFEKIKQFSKNCAAKVPSHFDELYAVAGDDKAKRTDVSRKLIEDQVRDLAQNGVTNLHVYTLNRVDLTADAIRAFNAEFGKDTDTQFVPRMVG